MNIVLDCPTKDALYEGLVCAIFHIMIYRRCKTHFVNVFQKWQYSIRLFNQLGINFSKLNPNFFFIPCEDQLRSNKTPNI